MGSATSNALVAVLGGVGLALLLFVPWAARRFRRHGGLGLGDVSIGLGVAVYLVAVLAYTLLPLPASDALACAGAPAGTQLSPLDTLAAIDSAGGFDSPAAVLANTRATELLLNIVLFVPLGLFVGHLAGRGLPRGVLRALLAGLGLSLLVEVTQVTGIWGLYSCAYRVFDVDDLLANSFGALLGGFAAPLLRLVPGQRSREPDRVRRVTLLRRLLGMASDVLAVVLTFGVLAGIAAVVDVVVGQADGLSARSTLLIGLVPALAQLVLVLRTGRTLGEAVVRLRPVPRPGVLRRGLRWAAGIGGWTVLGALGLVPWQAAWTVAALLGVLLTRDRRGLAAALAGLRVLDDRDPAAVTPPLPPPAPAASATGSPPR